jgi:iron complex transport system ATP-binding protein
MQGHTRNPLADPGLLGVSAGAALAVVIGIYAFGVTTLLGYVWFAFAGAFAASVAVFVLGSLGPGGASPVSLALAGVAVTALLGAMTSAIVLVDVSTLDAYRFWAVGALAGRGPDVALQVAPFVLGGLVIGLAGAPGLNLLALGDDVARGLGQNVTLVRWSGLVAITLLTGAAVAACGPIAFCHVLLDGKRIDRTPTREVAKVLGVLPQAPVAPEGLTVADLVARGRHPHQTWYRQWSTDDESAVGEALAWTGMTEFATRTLDQLSGGQRQRAWISMALAQGTDVVLLDEPTTYLDLAHQVDVLDLVERLNREMDRTVVMVLHDLNLAARYAGRLVAMRAGRIVASGTPDEVLTEDLLCDVFGLDARVVPDPVTGTPLVVPIGRRSRVDPARRP